MSLLQNAHIEGLVKDGDFLSFKGLVSKYCADTDKILTLFNKYRKDLDLEPVEILNDSKDKKFGCLMVDVDIPNWGKLKDLIDPEDLYTAEGDKYGFEDETHVTVLYGFHDEIQFKHIDAILSKFAKDYIPVKLTKISSFENEDFDVLKFDIESEELVKLNKVFKKLPHTTKFPNYNPHATIAYLKSGTAQKYIERFTMDNPIEVNVIEFCFSTKDRQKDRYSLTERELKAMKHAVAVDVKDQCKLGGGKTCDMGNIDNFNFSKIK